MKKIIQLSMTIVIVLVSFALVSCQQQDNSLDLKKELKEVNIFKSNEFKKESSDLIVSSNDTDNTKILETVKNIIRNATKQEGVVDTTEPNYDL